MRVVKFEDRIFEVECGNCKALLRYQECDVKTINTVEVVPVQSFSDYNKTVKLSHKEYAVIKRWLDCPICKCENHLNNTFVSERN